MANGDSKGQGSGNGGPGGGNSGPGGGNGGPGGGNGGPGGGDHGPQRFQIQIDREHFTVTKERMTGAEIRRLPAPPIGPDRDLFEVVPGGTDRKIEDTTVVEIRNGLRFFTAPAHINPGC